MDKFIWFFYSGQFLVSVIGVYRAEWLQLSDDVDC